MNPDEVLLWIDDLRDPKDFLPEAEQAAKIIWARTAAEALAIIRGGRVGCISFDNDLGTGQMEGYEIFSQVEQWIEDGTIKTIPQMRVHSANPVAAARLRQAIQRLRERHPISEK